MGQNTACIRTRLNRLAAKKSKKTNSHYHYPSAHRIKRFVNSMDDCFDDMHEPMYGIKVQIKFEQVCQNGECTVELPQCKPNDENCNRRSFGINRQTGEEFSSDGPAECRQIDTC